MGANESQANFEEVNSSSSPCYVVSEMILTKMLRDENGILHEEILFHMQIGFVEAVNNDNGDEIQKALKYSQEQDYEQITPECNFTDGYIYLLETIDIHGEKTAQIFR